MGTKTIDAETFPKNPASWADTGLTWLRSRWHLEGKPIHAGDGAWLLEYIDEYESDREPDWLKGRIETEDAGRILFFVVEWGGHHFRLRIRPSHRLRPIQ